jgi:hypothetical protein
VRATRHTRAGERGAFLLVFALCSTLLLTLVAFAVDLGQGRFQRRSNQQLVDLASLAAGRSLAGFGAPNEWVVAANPHGACADVITSVQSNADDFAPALTAAEIASSCAVFYNPYGANASGVAPCTATSAPVEIAPIARGPYVLRIRHPVPAAELADARFAGPGAKDGSDQCQRMRVTVERTDATTFARVLGVDAVESRATAVVRGGPTSTGTGVAAVLLLERTGCPALYTSGQGRLRVESPGPTNPGVIASDSSGFCGQNPQNQNGYTIYAPNASPEDGGPRIIAQSSANGTQGVIGAYALTAGGNAGCCYPAGLSVDLSPVEEPTSRRPADDRFNPVSPDPARETIRTRHAVGYDASVTRGAEPLAGSLETGCDPGSVAGIDTAQSITVICATGLNVANGETLAFDAATDVKFIGDVTVSGTLHLPVARNVTIARPTPAGKGRLIVSGTASFDSAQRIDIAGTPDTCTQGGDNCLPVGVSGTLRVNTGSISQGGCGAARPSSASLATFGGTLSITGSLAFCETSVYVGTDTPSYAQQWVITGGGCSEEKPCHVATTANARDRFLLSGGGSAIEWTAPDQTGAPPSPTSPFEGLALWVEGSGLSQVKGTGEMRAAGVFFLPNATFELGGQGTGDNPRNAQFFARRLEFSGQGLFRFLPDPSDAVPTVIPGAYALIR